MDLIPHDELKPTSGINYAPMIDFLFLMLALFATLAISKASLYDAEIHLAEIKSPSPTDTMQNKKEIQQINISILANGQFKWLTEFQEYPMIRVEEIQEELARQYQIGALAQDKSQTEILFAY